MDKYDQVKPVRWHMIGHLQTNKVKYIIDKVDMIHSVDSLKLAKEINKRAANHDKIMDVLVQVNSAQEESKFGVTSEETGELIDAILANCPNVKICGLMCIAPFDENPDNVRKYFAELKKLYDVRATAAATERRLVPAGARAGRPWPDRTPRARRGLHPAAA